MCVWWHEYQREVGSEVTQEESSEARAETDTVTHASSESALDMDRLHNPFILLLCLA